MASTLDQPVPFDARPGTSPPALPHAPPTPNSGLKARAKSGGLRAGTPNSGSRPQSKQQRISPSKHSLAINDIGPIEEDGMDLEELLTPQMRKPKEDPWKRVMKLIDREHHRQVQELRDENEHLKLKLNSVLATTWSLSDEGWTGSPKDPEFGGLQLTSAKNKDPESKEPGSPKDPETKSNDHGTKETLHEVTEEFIGRRAALEKNVEFNAREIWHKSRKEELMEKAVETNENHLEDSAAGYNELDVLPAHQPSCCLVLHPHSRLRLGWDVAGAFVLFYDMVMVPMGAFEPEETPFMKFMDWFTLTFWTADIILSFMTGYISKGGFLIMNCGQIAFHYMGGMFFVDLWIVGLDWFFTAIKETGEGGMLLKGDNVSKLIRAFRVVRVYRLMRLKKLRQLWISIKDRIESELVFVIPTFCQLIFLVIMGNHFLAALWYLTGQLSKQLGHKSWIQALDMEDEDAASRYFTALAYTFSNFALSSTKTEAQNVVERGVAAVVTIIGVCVFFTSAGVITCGIINSNVFGEDASKEFWLLRRYLRQNKIPSSLRSRVINYAEASGMREVGTLKASKVSLLPLLSEPLQRELKFEMDFSCIVGHPLIMKTRDRPVILQNFATDVLSREKFWAGDSIYGQEQPAKYMWFVAFGSVRFYKTGGAAEKLLKAEDWLAEAALWVAWAHQGNAQAIATTEMIMLDSNTFGKVVERDVELWSIMSKYAEMFIEQLNASKFEEMSDVADSAINKASFLLGQVMAQMPKAQVKKAESRLSFTGLTQTSTLRDSAYERQVTPDKSGQAELQ